MMHRTHSPVATTRNAAFVQMHCVRATAVRRTQCVRAVGLRAHALRAGRSITDARELGFRQYDIRLVVHSAPHTRLPSPAVTLLRELLQRVPDMHTVTCGRVGSHRATPSAFMSPPITASVTDAYLSEHSLTDEARMAA